MKSLGFDSFIISGTVKSGGSSDINNHVLCAVRIGSNELYLLDLGVGLPFPEPIPLHNLPYIHRAGGHRIMYRKSLNEFYECVQLDGALGGVEFVSFLLMLLCRHNILLLFFFSQENSETEYVRYDFTLQPRTLDFFKEPLNFVFTDPQKSVFLQAPLLFRYFNESEDGEMMDEAQLTGDRKFILFRGDIVVIGTNETKSITGNEEAKDIIRKYFPKLRKENVEKSLELFYTKK